MNRVGLKDYLLNEASDNDLLDCAKAYDAANQYGHFDTYDSVDEVAKLCGWDAETALSESRHVEQDADCYRFNGYGHLEAVSNERLLEDARDEIDNIIDWLEGASRYELMDISTDVSFFVDAKDPFEIINEADCSSHNHGNDIEVISQRWRTPQPRATMRTPMAPAPKRCRRRFSRRAGEGCRTLVRTT